MNNKILILAILVVVVSGGLFLFRSNQTPESPVVKETTTVSPTEVEQVVDTKMAKDNMALKEAEDKEMTDDMDKTMEDETMKVFEVEGGKFYFSPEEIRVNQGDTVKIVFNNVDGVHDWVIDEFDARTEIIDAGKTDEVTFIADQVGTFEFYCSVGNHRELGMVGNLIVE